mgnify:CR=1 FL=1
MKIESQVCSLEPAQKLKELGVKQESLYFWVEKVEQVGKKYEYEWILSHNKTGDGHSYAEWGIPAFTSAELGELLPSGMPGNNNIEGTTLHIARRYGGGWICGYSVHHTSHSSEHPHTKWLHYECADTIADAMAKMLIYLIENKLITI